MTAAPTSKLAAAIGRLTPRCRRHVAPDRDIQAERYAALNLPNVRCNAQASGPILVPLNHARLAAGALCRARAGGQPDIGRPGRFARARSPGRSAEDLAAMADFGRAIVVGAGGGMGRMFLERLAEAGCETIGVDAKASDGVVAADILDLSHDMRLALSSADMTILAVPDAVACRAAPEVARAIAPDAILVDCTSVKAPYVEAVGDAGTCGLVSVNPLFGPGLAWTGRSIVVTELRVPRFPERLTRFLEGFGLEIIRLDAEHHDRLAAEGQAQLHAAILAFITSASAAGMMFDTPPNRVMRMLAARILSGSPHVYWEIQTSNPFAGEARRRLITALQTLDQLCAGGDREGFSRLLLGARDNLGANTMELSEQCVKLFSAID